MEPCVCMYAFRVDGVWPSSRVARQTVNWVRVLCVLVGAYRCVWVCMREFHIQIQHWLLIQNILL